MQDIRPKKPNQERSRATREALINAARALFVAKGYADTSTPEIVAAARITRGALYHHFADKQALFGAVAEAEAQAVARAITQATLHNLSPHDALIEGSLAYLDAMAVPGRVRLLLLEGPAVLGTEAMAALDHANAARTLREGVAAANTDPTLSSDALAELLSATFDRAALMIARGDDAATIRRAMTQIITRVLPDGG